MVWGLRQHQEQQEKRVEGHQGALEMLNSKIDVLLEAVNGGRLGYQNGNGKQEECLNFEHYGVSANMKFHSIKLEFPRFDRENPTGWIYKESLTPHAGWAKDFDVLILYRGKCIDMVSRC